MLTPSRRRHPDLAIISSHLVDRKVPSEQREGRGGEGGEGRGGEGRGGEGGREGERREGREGEREGRDDYYTYYSDGTIYSVYRPTMKNYTYITKNIT